MVDKKLNNLPDSNEIWKGIGGHFDSLGQIVAEFIDNSITNIIANKPPSRNIALRFEDQGASTLVTIEDTGSGISNLENAFRLGGKAEKQGPLNEHGFGMKHALASANPENDDWELCTRTQNDFNTGSYKRITAPYLIQDILVHTAITSEEPWPGQFNGTGTFVKFRCSREMFNTLRTGMPGQPSFATCITYLVEDLGFLYAGLIEKNVAAFTVTCVSNGNSNTTPVAAINPDWEKFYDPGTGEEDFDLGNGKVHLKYQFGAMKESEYKKYYKRNMSSSGLEIRINGRVIAYNLFKEVWNRERHNMYNHFLVIVDVISYDLDHLPPTRTSKNGLRQGDPRLDALYDWVRRHLPTPPKEIGEAADERDLFEELRNQKKFHVPDPKTVLIEQYVFTSIGEKIRVDLYLAFDDQVWIYEGKKDTTTVKDVYQLKMYWDGAALDNLKPTKGVLIASYHPSSVIKMVKHLNSMNDIKGNKYKIETKIWIDEGIQYQHKNI